jgi:hypothetical protein
MSTPPPSPHAAARQEHPLEAEQVGRSRDVATGARRERGWTRELAIRFVDDHQPVVGATVCGGGSGRLAGSEREPGVDHAERVEDPLAEVVGE